MSKLLAEQIISEEMNLFFNKLEYNQDIKKSLKKSLIVFLSKKETVLKVKKVKQKERKCIVLYDETFSESEPEKKPKGKKLPTIETLESELNSLDIYSDEEHSETEENYDFEETEIEY